jgi:hypothetical protein
MDRSANTTPILPAQDDGGGGGRAPLLRLALATLLALLALGAAGALLATH